MALSAFTGSFALNAGTGNQSITGVGFQPKAIIFYSNSRTSDGNDAIGYFNLGIATSSTARASTAATIQSDVERRHTTDKCFHAINSSGTVQYDADFVSFDSDGFTVNLTTTVSGTIINFLALGGSDITNATVKQFICPATTGNQSETGVGFQPDAIFIISSSSSSAPPANEDFANSQPGFAVSSTKRGAMGIGTNATGGVAERLQSAAHVFYRSGGSGTVSHSADFVSMDSDGFTLNWTAAPSARYFHVLCLKGGSYTVGSFNQATSTGNQSVSGLGFQPSGVIFMSFNNTTNSAVQSSVRNTFGSATSSSARSFIWLGANNGIGTVGATLNRTNVIGMITEAATTNAIADFVSNDSDGFTVNWTTADATAREIIYFAAGSTPAGTNKPKTFSMLGVG